MLYNSLMALSRALRFLPHGALLFLGALLGRLYYMIIKKQRELAVRQMMQGLSISEEEARRIVRASFVNLAQNMLEILYMPKLNRENLHKYIEIEHLERLKDALAEGHGVVVLTGHIGTWEWLSAAFSLSGLPVTAIAKTQPRGTSELLAAGRALKNGKILGFLADQDAGPGGAFIEFLGKTAATPLGPAVFSRKFRAPVVPAFILRRSDGRHTVRVYERMEYVDTGDTEKDLYDLTVRMTHLLEEVIRENPTQWLWFQKRWNTPPEMKKEKHHGAMLQGGKDEA